jgi:hypothetical protein
LAGSSHQPRDSDSCETRHGRWCDLPSLGNEHAASYQHMAAIKGSCSPASAVDRIEAGFCKSRSDVGFEATKRLAELPAGTLQSAHPSLPCRRPARSSFPGTPNEQRGARKPLHGPQERARALPLLMAIWSQIRIRRGTVASFASDPVRAYTRRNPSES